MLDACADFQNRGTFNTTAGHSAPIVLAGFVEKHAGVPLLVTDAVQTQQNATLHFVDTHDALFCMFLASVNLSMGIVAHELAAALRSRRQTRSVPSAAEGLNQQHGVRHSTAQNVNRSDFI
jgi:hypothetical protein